MKQQRTDPGWSWAKRLEISAGALVGETIWLFVLVAFDSEGEVVGSGV